MDSRYVVLALICLALVAITVWLWLRRPTPRGVSAPVAYGLDFSWGRPPIPSIKAGGWSFVCRYHSWDEYSGKNLTAAEAKSYLDAGIAVVSNWQYESDAALQGFERGYADAVEALWQHEQDGGDEYAPIYFSVDWDVQSHQYSAVADYFLGIYQAYVDYGVSDPLSRIGVYGGIDIVRYLFDCNFVRYGWQTYAWSGGKWDKRAQLRQTLNSQDLDGHAVDYDEAWADNYGAWGQAARERLHRMGDGAVILNCPYDDDRLDIFYVAPDGDVVHKWYESGGMSALWSGDGSSETLGGVIVPGTLSAAWDPQGTLINVIGLGAPDDDAAPAGAGQYWGFTLTRSGGRSGWGSLSSVYGQLPAAGARSHRIDKPVSEWSRPAMWLLVAAVLLIAASLASLWLK